MARRVLVCSPMRGSLLLMASVGPLEVLFQVLPPEFPGSSSVGAKYLSVDIGELGPLVVKPPGVEGVVSGSDGDGVSEGIRLGVGVLKSSSSSRVSGVAVGIGVAVLIGHGGSHGGSAMMIPTSLQGRGVRYLGSMGKEMVFCSSGHKGYGWAQESSSATHTQFSSGSGGLAPMGTGVAHCCCAVCQIWVIQPWSGFCSDILLGLSGWCEDPESDEEGSDFSQVHKSKESCGNLVDDVFEEKVNKGIVQVLLVLEPHAQSHASGKRRMMSMVMIVGLKNAATMTVAIVQGFGWLVPSMASIQKE
ncbi:hypothetical protein ARMGADRAFT_1033787 [Armillaria gallica]|uniref:Uncharacterized protein n=1 Tax=Armillaria gallica TaxID=47427 RepID=A0A2H3DMY4_ARMGA|nr:hypothetical protein ARMGADRAFT_1033787 [Armillaria gallica]